MTEADEEWSEERFIADAKQNANLNPARLIQVIFAEADVFAGAAIQYDDMTLLVIKINQ